MRTVTKAVYDVCVLSACSSGFGKDVPDSGYLILILFVALFVQNCLLRACVSIMSIIESPLNIAHRHRRKAQAYAVAHKYDEAIREHATAAEILSKLMNTIDCEIAKESIKLQHDDHLHQLSIIMRKQKGAELKKTQESTLQCVMRNHPEFVLSQNKQDTYKTNKLIHQAVQAMCEQTSLITGITDSLKQFSVSAASTNLPLDNSVVKITKDDKAKFEELFVSNGELKKILFLLIADIERIRSENKTLRNSFEELLFYHDKCVSLGISTNLQSKDMPSKSSTDVDYCKLTALLPVSVPNMV